MDGLCCRRCGGACDACDRFCRHCGASRAPRARWRLTRTITAITFVAALLTLAAADDDVIEGVATRIEVEPKLIRVTCPDAPQVDVEDLGPDSQARNECLVFQVAAPDLDARLVVKCDGELDSDRSFYGDFV